MRRIRAAALAALVPAALAGAPGAAAAQGLAWDALSSSQRQALARGEQVVVYRDSAGTPWPEVTVYRLVVASPEQAAAAFTEYAEHRRYVPEVKQSRVSRVVDPVTTEVDYELSVPLFPDEQYTVRDRVSTYDGGRAYRVDRTMVRASSTRGILGSVRFEPYPADASGRTLMAYRNFVIPGSGLAGVGFVKSRALGQMRETAKAIAERAESSRRTHADALAASVARLRAALAASASAAPK